MKIRILLLSILFLQLISCNDDDSVNLPVDTDSFVITVTPSNVTEDAGLITFNLELPIATQTDVYTYDLTGTTTISEDYEFLSDELSFTVSEGASTASISITIIDDLDVEEEETIIVTLRTRNGTIISDPPTATITIEDNDDFPFENGFLISNQGVENNGIGTVSYVNADFSQADNQIYQSVNQGSNLGNSVHSIGFYGDFAYVVSSGSDLITVVNRFTFEEINRITIGLENPRHFVAIGDTGYVSNRGDISALDDDFIAVINLTQNIVSEIIPVQHGVEKLEVNGTDLIVAHQGTNSQPNNIISIIDTTRIDEAPVTIEVGDIPSSMQLDGQGNLLVLSEGLLIVPSGQEPSLAKISMINLVSNNITTIETFTPTQRPSLLNVEGDFVYYYLANNVLRLNVNSLGSPVDVTVTGVTFTNMNVIGNSIIGLNATSGTLEAYNASTFDLIDSQAVGVLPNEVYMN